MREKLTAQFYQRDFQSLLVPPRAAMTIQGYSWSDRGGPREAKISAEGDETAIWALANALRAFVKIFDDKGRARWWGYVHEVEISYGNYRHTVSVEAMRNSIAATYSRIDPVSPNRTESIKTSFLENADSVSEYGRHQMIYSASDLTSAAAAALQATLLNTKKWPRFKRVRDDDGGQASATITCRGLFTLLDWTYYTDTTGYMFYDLTGAGQQPVGLGFIGNTVAFIAASKTIGDTGGRFINFTKGDKIRVTGSASNNGVFTVDQGTSLTVQTYTANTISFDAATKQIRDSANQLIGAANELIRVTGSVGNDGFYTLDSTAGDNSYIKTVQTLVNGAAGPSVTITRANDIKVVETPVNEMPGASVTIEAFGKKIRQSIIATGDKPWPVNAISVRLKKVGSPSDSLTVALYAADGTTLLGSGTIVPAAVFTEINYVQVGISPVTITPGVGYFIHVERGVIDPANYYQIDVNDEASYVDGVFTYWNAQSAFTARAPGSDMPFALLGEIETTKQIEQMLAAAQTAQTGTGGQPINGPFFTGVDIEQPSGIFSNPFRLGDTTVANEILKLMEVGNSNGQRLIADVTEDRRLRIYSEPLSDPSSDYLLNKQGELRTNLDGPVSANGKLLVGVHARLSGVIPPTTALRAMENPETEYIEGAEYDAQTGKVRYEFRGASDDFSVGAQQG